MPDTLPLRSVEAPSEPKAVGPLLLLYDSSDMCAVLRIGLATLHRLKAGGRLPRARKLAGLKWDADEVRRWVVAGMPPLKEWEPMEAARLKSAH
jgi:hypothetical protein